MFKQERQLTLRVGGPKGPEIALTKVKINIVADLTEKIIEWHYAHYQKYCSYHWVLSAG